MERIAGAYAVDIGSGRMGYRDRNLALGQAGTTINAAGMNPLQEEIARAIELQGIALDSANREQLAKAIRRMAASNVTALTATTALTPDHAGTVLVSAAGGNVGLSLPAVNAAGGSPLRLTVIRTDTSGNTLSVQRAGTDTINALAGPIAVPIGGSIELIGDGASAWRIGRVSGFIDVRVIITPGVTSQTAPIWARKVRARLWGGGGGGGGAASGAFNAAAMAGAGSGYAEGTYLVVPGAALSCTNGAGGIRGTGSPLTSGGTGGTSSVGSLASATGGGGGGASGGGIQTGTPAAGTGSGGQFNLGGATGQPGFLNGTAIVAAVGGASHGTGYGSVASLTAGFNGYDAGFPGLGGNGGVGGVAFNGGSGAHGCIILEFFP